MTVSEPEAHRQKRTKTEPSFGASFRVVDVGCTIGSRCQVLSVRRKLNTTNNTKHGKHIVSLVIPVIEATERMGLLTIPELGYEPS